MIRQLILKPYLQADLRLRIGFKFESGDPVPLAEYFEDDAELRFFRDSELNQYESFPLPITGANGSEYEFTRTAQELKELFTGGSGLNPSQFTSWHIIATDVSGRVRVLIPSGKIRLLNQWTDRPVIETNFTATLKIN